MTIATSKQCMASQTNCYRMVLLINFQERVPTAMVASNVPLATLLSFALIVVLPMCY
jgi:hypothetical protein